MTETMTDERKLRRFAMDVVRAMGEEKIDAGEVRRLAIAWGLIEAGTMDGQPWLTFTPLLLGDELTRDLN